VPADSAHGPDSVAAAAAPTHGTPEVAEPGPAAVRPAATKPPTDPAAKAAAYKQVARVLSAMKPPEAAQVLSLLSDDEVEGILRAVGPRQAADFLTNIPKERAATLSRRLLVPRPEGASR
jgi:flagellar motility protein MotE (MotC chaperone)